MARLCTLLLCPFLFLLCVPGCAPGPDGQDAATQEDASDAAPDGSVSTDAVPRDATLPADADAVPPADAAGHEDAAVPPPDASVTPDASVPTDGAGAPTDGADAATPHDCAAPMPDLAAPPCDGVCVLGQRCAVPGKLACAGHAQKVSLICDGTYHWATQAVCGSGQLCDSAGGLDQGTCAAIDPACAASQPGDLVCAGDSQVRCGPDLVTHTLVASCGAGRCVAGMCVAAPVCTTGRRRCDGNTAQTCDSYGQWQDTRACGTDTCIAGTCTAPVCTPGQTQCAMDMLQTCGSDGQWLSAQLCGDFLTCIEGMCVPYPVCTEGQTSCLANTVQTCNHFGQWQSTTDCSPRICQSGACSDPVCTVGQTRCDGQSAQICVSPGKWQNSKWCGYACQNGACIDECSAGQTRCNGKVVQTCQNGQWTNGTVCSPACVDGSCSSIPEVTQIATGDWHTCALLTNGTVYCWGANQFGQLGIGTTSNGANQTPNRVVGLTGVTQITAGDAHTCALLQDGQVYCWGNNASAQLGNGSWDELPHATPALVPGLTGVTQLDAGRGHTCAVLQDGTVKCWGDDSDGQLGSDDGETCFANLACATSPQTVPSLTGVTQVAAGFTHSCAVTAGGTLKCWGANGSGQLGDGTTTDRTVPTPALISGVTQVTTGTMFTCALVADGHVWCWGANNEGQLGYGSTYSATPTQLGVLTDMTQVSAGRAHACAIRQGGIALCWGANDRGQLGDWTPTVDNFFIAGPGTPYAQLSAGGNTTCAVEADTGKAYSWGDNSDGELGRPSTATCDDGHSSSYPCSNVPMYVVW